jgi:hypothetical protein
VAIPFWTSACTCPWWFDPAHAPLRQRYGGPADLTFQTEPQLALATGAPAWAVFRRSTDKTKALKVFLSNAPQICAPEDLVRVSGLRWSVETAIEEAKGELGMDHYEIRTWRGWHHPMTQTFLAHHVLVRMRLRVKKSACFHRAPSAVVAGHRLAGAYCRSRASDGNRQV